MYYEEPLIDSRVQEYADTYGLDAKELDWHLEAIHGWEPHDRDYVDMIPQAARCLIEGGCEDQFDSEEEKD